MKTLQFTDIHFGKHQNSTQHNQDAIQCVLWVCALAKQYNCDRIVFNGDWHDDRNKLNIETLNYSYNALNVLNQQSIPVIMVVGNHDLYHRHNRDIDSLIFTNNMDNIVVIRQPTAIHDYLFCPFLFRDEYKLLKTVEQPYVIGHFEFNGFVVTGSSHTLTDKDDHKLYNQPKRIFSGHFHRRQQKDNVVYIGNTFPMDFGDVNDMARGCAIFDDAKPEAEQLRFFNWQDGPAYLSFKLSTVIDDPINVIRPNSHVDIIMDIPLSKRDAHLLPLQYISDCQLRSCTLTDPSIAQLKQSLSGGAKVCQDTIHDVANISNVDLMIKHMLADLDVPNIQNTRLLKMYDNLIENS